jgi:hypothetical protein
VVVLVLGVLFGAWVYGVLRWGESVSPAGDTLADHLTHRPPPDRVTAFEVDGRKYVALFGPWQAFPRFPSGPPVYVFDVRGRLVDWCPDTGDAYFNPKWHGAYRGRDVAAEELARWPK